MNLDFCQENGAPNWDAYLNGCVIKREITVLPGFIVHLGWTIAPFGDRSLDFTVDQLMIILS